MQETQETRMGPRVGKASWRKKQHPLQYSCLEGPQTEEPGGLQSWGLGESDTTERLSTSEHFYFCRQNKTKPVTSRGLGQGLW